MKKKALILANQGGFASFLLSDMDLLYEMGYEVVYGANGQLPWEDTKAKIKERSIRFVQIDFDTKNPFAKKNLTAFKQISALLKEKFDLIHCHTPITGFLTRIAARKYRKKGAKVIYTTHGFAFTKYSSKKSRLLYYGFERMTSGMCDAIITINREDYKNAKTMNCKNVYLINGVGVKCEKYKNVSVDRREYRKMLGIPLDKTMILSVGELSERKNHRIIIEALALMKNKNDYVYVICGNGINGGTGEMLRTLAKEKGISLILLGFRHDIPQIIATSDIGAIPSIREGLGLAGIESLAEGVPLAASDVQGICDYVVNGETGFLCSPFDEHEFALAIEKLSDSSVREKMNEKCRLTAENFSMEKSLCQRKAIYKELLE